MMIERIFEYFQEKIIRNVENSPVHYSVLVLIFIPSGIVAMLYLFLIAIFGRNKQKEK